MKINPLLDDVIASLPAGLPRYTSYPPANHFQPKLGAKLGEAFVAAVDGADAVSAYVHIPYCDRLCWFCGCHTKQTLRYDPIRSYVATLAKEIDQWGKRLQSHPRLSRLHLGGGSPSLLKAPELVVLRSALATVFKFDGNTEVSVEIDPSDIQQGQIESLINFGMTRASIGVQDFDPVVQAAINRPQSFDTTKNVVDALRGARVKSINIDALYGLPLQTAERLMQTVRQVIDLAPDRIALFGYAHVPWLKVHQNLIKTDDLPTTRKRFEHARMASDAFVRAGYEAIGIDHFARPHDALALAAHAGKLRRNFQGYTDDTADVLLPLGSSSIGKFPGGYVQNEIATGQYTARVNAGNLPFNRGFGSRFEDEMRGFVIERLMCDFAVSIDALQTRFGNHCRAMVDEAERLAVQDLCAFCEMSGGVFKIKREARPFARLVASKFDTWLTAGKQQYSKAV